MAKARLLKAQEPAARDLAKERIDRITNTAMGKLSRLGKFLKPKKRKPPPPAKKIAVSGPATTKAGIWQTLRPPPTPPRGVGGGRTLSVASAFYGRSFCLMYWRMVEC